MPSAYICPILFAFSASAAAFTSSTCDDHQSLLQARVAQPITTQPARSPIQARANTSSALLQSMTDMAFGLQSGTLAPEDVGAAIAATNSALATVLPALESDHDHGQNEMNRQFAEIEDCSTHATNGILATTQNSVALEEQNEELAGCNTQLAAAQQEQATDCGAYTNHVSTLVNSQPPRLVAGQFYEGFQEAMDWFASTWASVESHQIACNDATAAASAKQDDCATQTTEHDQAFCEHRLSCAILRACQARAIQLYHDQEVEVRAAMLSRQSVYATLTQTQCLLGLITSAHDEGATISTEQITQCTSAESPDMSALTIAFHTLPAPQACPSPESGDPECPGLAEASAHFIEGGTEDGEAGQAGIVGAVCSANIDISMTQDDSVGGDNVASQSENAIPFGSGSMHECGTDGPGGQPAGLGVSASFDPINDRMADGSMHCYDRINDGMYGNSRSWIPHQHQQTINDLPMFVGIAFDGIRSISSFSLGRDRLEGTDTNTGFRTDRTEGTYNFEFTTVANPTYTTPDAEWCSAGTFTRNTPLLMGFQLSEPVQATGVRMVVSTKVAAIDELEVYGHA